MPIRRFGWVAAAALLASSPAQAETSYVPMCKIRDDGVEKTRLVPPSKVQSALDKGLTRGECIDPANGRVLCKTKRGKRVNALLPDSMVQRALDKGFFTLGECDDSLPLLPPFLSSSPAEGETVSRSAWLVARFAGEVAARAEDRVWLSCDGSPVPHAPHPLAPIPW